MIRLLVSLHIALGTTILVLKPTPILILLGLELILNGAFLAFASELSISGNHSFVIVILFFLALAVVETVILTTSQIKAEAHKTKQT